MVPARPTLCSKGGSFLYASRADRGLALSSCRALGDETLFYTAPTGSLIQPIEPMPVTVYVVIRSLSDPKASLTNTSRAVSIGHMSYSGTAPCFNFLLFT